MLTNKYVSRFDLLIIGVIIGSFYLAWHGAEFLLVGNWSGDYSASLNRRSENVGVRPVIVSELELDSIVRFADYRGGCLVGFHSRASFCASAIRGRSAGQVQYAI
jgi:hypothetical protein